MTRRLKPKVSKTCSMQQNSSQTQTFKNFSILYKLVLSNMWTLNNAKSFAAFYYARRKFSVCFVLFFRLRETSKFTLSLFFSRVEKMWKLLENMLNRNCRMVSKWYAMYIASFSHKGLFWSRKCAMFKIFNCNQCSKWCISSIHKKRISMLHRNKIAHWAFQHQTFW